MEITWDLTTPRITREGNTIIGEYEPGNGTRYTAIAVPWTADSYLTMGMLGNVTDGWLVISGNSGRAYLFQKEGTLVDEYIADHLGGDYPYFGHLIRQMLGRPVGLPRQDMPDDPESYHNERAERIP